MLTQVMTLLITAASTSPGVDAKQVPTGVLRMAKPRHELSERNSTAGVSKAYGG